MRTHSPRTLYVSHLTRALYYGHLTRTWAVLTVLQVSGDGSRDAHLGAGGGLGHIGGLCQASHEGCGVVIPGDAPAGMPRLPPSLTSCFLRIV